MIIWEDVIFEDGYEVLDEILGYALVYDGANYGIIDRNVGVGMVLRYGKNEDEIVYEYEKYTEGFRYDF